MTTIERDGPRRDVSLLLAGVGLAVFLVTVPLGHRAALVGVAAFVGCLILSFLETERAVVTWPNAIAGLVVVIWLIPIKGYALPIDLPFNVEHYRLAILGLALALTVAVVTRRRRLSFAGRFAAIVLLCGGAVVAAIQNGSAIDASSGEPQAALKSLSYFLSFFIVFVLVCSVIDSLEAVDTVVRTLVLGGVAVGIAAMYEARSGYNVFDHLHQWLPGLERQFRDVSSVRGGRFRVYASAQHPIALAVALTMMLPLALYLSTRAATRRRSYLWLGAAGVLATAVGTTVSRTPVVMLAVMLVVALLLRPHDVARFWPALIALPIALHFVAPGAMGGIYKSFFPEGGLVNSLGGRAGEGGSGRFADIDPGFTFWSQKPVFGHGLGVEFPSTDASLSPGQDPLPLIFDNQYLDVLAKLGIIGLLGTIAFFVAGAVVLARRSRTIPGPPGTFLATAATAASGFAAAMFFLDAYAFVQATIICVMIIALGYRVVEVSSDRVGTARAGGG